ncbi:hypothetical protein BDU57DRAFT_531793 [Ampelomyces quisqualis]|uniref:Uncharacterized protein n=1 Tax=Ampelomyces quisqualis TaxID=50730 RepID=A0A6A5QGK7_AMPQU|nr:hypothetical protein BDU57DRAFT_531793 [Ampelomyces quisqualis]
MSFSILNMISDIKSGRPVGIVKQRPLSPRQQPMYGRKGGITMGQHLDEFDSYKDSEGRSFDKIVTDGLLAEDNKVMNSPPKPQVARSDACKSSALDLDDDKTFMEKLFYKQNCKYLVPNPRYREHIEEAAISGPAKRKADSQVSDIQAHNIKVLGGGSAGDQSTTENDNARKRPRTGAYFKE